MGEFFHSVTLDRERCMGCTNCIKRCPTGAIRVREGKATISSERCIDCGECIRICPHHAKQAIYDPLESIERFRYKIALPAPSLYAQFNNLEDTDLVLSALEELGFDEVYEVACAAELVSDATRRYLAADGIENVIRVLEDLEDEKLGELDFVELNACSGGCVGGVLTVENPYIARAKLKLLRRYLPVSRNHLTGEESAQLLWDAPMEYEPVLELGGDASERFARYSEMQRLLAVLPGLDCGSCGAPSCAALAEDIVRGEAATEDCVVLMRERMEAVLRALRIDRENHSGV